VTALHALLGTAALGVLIGGAGVFFAHVLGAFCAAYDAMEEAPPWEPSEDEARP